MAQTVEELYSLLVPLNQERLIVPRACVAEVIRFTPPRRSGDGPAWYLGTIPWGERTVPVVSFEELAGLTPVEPGGRTRIAIMTAITGRLQAGCFGILTEGFPQLVRVNREVIQPDDRHPWPEAGPVICRLRMINEYPLVPDFEVIEDMLQGTLDELADGMS
jgi:chemosensory pili system protein ChpC